MNVRKDSALEGVVAMANLMERLLEYWVEESLQPNIADKPDRDGRWRP